jgi:hypothetical protein
VRRRFRKWAIVTGVLLVLLVAHTAWDYAEARWLKTAMGSLDPRQVELEPKVDPSRKAAPLYVAAEVLAQRQLHLQAVIEGNVHEALRAGAVSPDLVNQLQLLIDAQVDAFRLLDRATELEFRGFSYFGPQPSLLELVMLKRLAGLRAVHLALTSHPDAAAAALLAELGLEGAHDRPVSVLALRTWLISWRIDTAFDTQVVLDRGKPGEPALARLAAAFAAADEDDRLTRYFTLLRDRIVESAYQQVGGGTYGAWGNAGLLSGDQVTWFNRLLRPMIARSTRWQIAGYTAILEAARRPWPDRLDAILAVGDRTPWRPWYPPMASVAWFGFHSNDRGRVKELGFAATDIASVRAARIAIAVERYRRAHQEQLPSDLAALVPAYLDALPIDPYSGAPMRYKPAGSGYVVYSLGPNRKDDGGDGVDAPPFPRGATGGVRREVGDIGVRIRR